MTEEEKVSPLRERSKELYRQGQPTSSGIPTSQSTMDAIKKEPPIPPKDSYKPSWGDRFWNWLDSLPLRRGFIGIIVLGILVALVILWRGFFSFQNNSVIITIEPTQEVAVGEEIRWEVTIRNNNASAIENINLVFNYPELSLGATTSDPIIREERSIERISGRSSKTEEFHAIFIAGSKKEARATLSFTQEDSNITFDLTKSVEVTPAEFPTLITVEGPEETLPGEEVSVSFTIKSEAGLALKDLRARLIYPEQFVVSSASQDLEEANTIWRFETLTPGEERTLEVVGTINGEAKEGKVFRIVLEGRTGPTTWEEYTRESFRALLTETPLSVSIEGPSDGVLPGERLGYTIRWRNNFNASLSNVTVVLSLDGQMYDLQTLSADGAFNASTKTITWSEAQVPSLAVISPGASGEVSFSINLRKEYTPFGITNPQVRVRAVISSLTKPAGLTTAGVRAIQEDEVRIRGALNLEATAVRNEAVAPIQNTGPYPPKIGEETTFTLHWRLSVIANTVENVTVSAVLPSGVEWADEAHINGSFGEITYNSFAREVRWSIGELKANQGIFSTVPEAVFKVLALPAPSQEGDTMPLLGKTNVQGIDAFTGISLLEDARELDSSLGEKGGRVQP